MFGCGTSSIDGAGDCFRETLSGRAIHAAAPCGMDGFAFGSQ